MDSFVSYQHARSHDDCCILETNHEYIIYMSQFQPHYLIVSYQMIKNLQYSSAEGKFKVDVVDNPVDQSPI